MLTSWLGVVAATWLAILAPKMVQALTLVSPSPLECQSDMSSAMVSEWLPLAVSNKGTAGDRTGTIPTECLGVISSYFFGAVGERDTARQEAFLANFQRRYGTGQGAEELSVQAGYFQRKMIPAKQRAQVTCPVLILQGGADELASPVEEAAKWRDGFVNAKGGADLRTLADAPHLLAFFDPNVTSRFLLLFVKRCEPSPGCGAEQGGRQGELTVCACDPRHSDRRLKPPPVGSLPAHFRPSLGPALVSISLQAPYSLYPPPLLPLL